MPIDEQTINVLNKLYQYDPTKFKEEEVDTLEQFAPKFNIDFRRNQDAGEFNLLNTVKQLGEGFVEGLTTLPVSKWLNDEPKNSAEKIAYSIGSLMGFVGWIPNPVGIMSKLGLSTFLKVAGYGAKAAELSKGISLGIHFKSPTMWAADKIMGTLNKTLKPALEATSFLKGSKGIIAKDMIEGGLHLGIASAINTAPFYDLSWQTAVDERANAFLHGGMFGAGNRFIGNLFSRNGLLDLTGTVTGENLPGILKLAETDKKAAFNLLAKGDTANKVARMLSSGIVFGMPSTIANQPLELQVYDYLLNAYFGGKEMSTHQKEALKFSEPYQKTGRQQLLINPSKLKGYEDLSPKAKQEMAIQSDILLGGWNHEAENNNAYVSIMSGLKESDDVQSMLAKFEESPDLTDAQKQKYEVVAIQQKTIEDGLREGKSEEEIMREMPEKVSTALNNKYFYDIFKRVSEELTPEKFDNVGQEAINKFKDINGTFREYGLSTRWYNPIDKISDLVASKEGIKQGDVLTRLDTTNKVATVAGKLLKDRTISKDTFIEEVKKLLEIELTPEVTREITRLHNELSQAVPRTFYAIKSGGRLEPLSQVTPQGLPRNITWFPRSELDTFYTGVGELKTWEGMHDARGKWVQDETGEFGPPQKYGEIPIYDAVNQGRITEVEIIVNAAKAGKLIISGRKDDANILFADIPKDMDEATISKTIDIIKNRRETIEREYDVLDKNGKQQFNKKGYVIRSKKNVEISPYEEGKARFVKDALKAEGVTEEIASKIYDMTTANAVKGLIEWNFGKDVGIKEALDITEANPKAFVVNPMDIVKRMQIFNDRSPKLPEEEMIKRTGSDKFKFVILKTAKSGKKLLPWEDKSTFAYNAINNNKLISVLHEAHRDGGVLVRSDVFNHMLESTGYPLGGTTIKGVHIFGSDSKLGGFIGKLAYHKASTELDTYMFENDIHGFHLDTTAKQRGLRKLMDWTVRNGKFELLDDAGATFIPKTTSTMPEGEKSIVESLPEGIYDSRWNTLTVGNAEDMSHLNDKFTLAAQLQYNIEYDKPREAMVNYTRQYVVGTEVGQEAFKRFMLTKDYKELDNLDFEEDLGVSQKIEILKRNDNSKYWKKVIQEIFHTDPAEAEEILDNDTESYYQNWNEIQGSAKKIIDAGIEITPEVLMLPDIRKYYETSVKNWLISKTVSPKVKYAWKGTFKVHDPMIASNINIKPGEIWLDGGQKKQLIPYMGKEMTAEDALKIHLADPKNTPKVELVGVRVPMDSASGARVLELKGFVGEEGGGFYVHPEEYANMGGADNDIDTAFLYWNLPKEVVEYYRSKKDQWYTKMAGGGKIFVEQKRTPWLLAEKDELYRYDVISQLYGNKYSYEAKKNLGAFLSYGKRIKLFIQTQAKNGKITIQTKKGDKEYDVDPKTNVDFLVRELVNYSADAADGNRMKSVKDIRALLNYKIFGDAKINLFDDTTFKNMTIYDALRRGRSEEGQDYSAIGSIEALKGLPNYPHAIFEKMRMLADGVVPENLNKNIMPDQTSALLFKFKNMQGAVKDIMDKKIPKEKWTQEQKDSAEFTALAIKYAGKAKLGFSPGDYKWHVDKLMKDGYSENRAKAEVEEYKANDLLNLADIIDSIIKGKRLESTVLGPEAVKEIKTIAFDLRERLRIVNEDLAKAPSKKTTTKVKETREALLNEARAYKDKLANEDKLGHKRSYFESLLYSTAPGQNADKILKMKEDLAKLESAEKKDEKAINKLKDQIDRFNSRFYTTEKRNIFGSSDLIQPQTIKDRVKTFTALIKEARLLDPIKENEYAKVSANNPLANIIQEKTDVPMLTEPTKNVQEAERLNTLLKDTAKLKVTVADDISNRAKELFNKYPHLRRVFEDYYATWTLDTQGVAKELSTTTEPEITKFLFHMESMMNVNPDGLALRKVDYFLAPSSIARNFEGYEKGVSLKTVPVMNKRAEIIDRVVAVPNGRFQKLYNILRIGAISKDKKLSAAELNFAEHPIAKGYASIPIEDRIFMNDYVWKMREAAYTDQEFYQDRFKEVQGEFDAKYKDKVYQIRIGSKTVPMVGEKFAKFMNEYYSERMDNTLRDVIINQKGFDEFRLKYVKDGVMMIDKWTTNMMKHAQTKNELPFEGLNVVEFIKAQHLLRNYKFGGTETKEGMSAEQFSYNRDVREKDKAEYEFLMRYKNDPRYKKVFEDANAQKFTIPPKEFRDGYVPHMDFPQKLVDKQLAKLMEKYKDDPKKRKTIMLAMERYMSEGELSDLNSNEEFYKMFDGKDAMTNAKIENFMGSRSSNLLARNFEYPIGGYNTDYSAIAKYERSLYTQYYNSLTAILTHRNVDKFLYETNHSQNKIGAENAKYWAGFMRNKIRIALGAPSIFPKEMIDDKAYKIQGNPYYYLTDDYYARTSTMFDKFFGVDRKEMPQALIEKRVARKLATLSNLEAKWSMMSLLASPKAYLTNKLTAHLNTMVGAGFDYWKQAGSLEYLRRPEILGKHADSWESLKNWIDVNGGLESFIRAEAQLHPEFNTAKGKKLVEELILLHKQGKANSDSTIMELINRSGLADTITMKSAWFMRASEVDARLRAWTAHYLKAREIYDATNYSFDADDPWLIEQANKGVEATQFLYNIVERPDFASTSLGKIFARFQMFSMNSILWRKKIAENYHKGVDKEKFERLMAADMAVMGLASLLPYTIINAALPPPYNYLQQLTGWLFGDKTAREKAFFGAIPYPANIIQPLLPPSSRVVTSLFGLASGDFDSFLSYQVWTMFPFGRMARDTYRAMDNPHLFMEREFGIPYNTLINRIAKTKD